jgi:hypothetical protein
MNTLKEEILQVNMENFMEMLLDMVNQNIQDGTIQFFHDKQKRKQYMTNKRPLKRVSKEFCTQKIKANKTMKGQAVTNHKRRKDKESESNIDSAA